MCFEAHFVYQVMHFLKSSDVPEAAYPQRSVLTHMVICRATYCSISCGTIKSDDDCNDEAILGYVKESPLD